MKATNVAATLLYHAGTAGLLRSYWGAASLTVLAYHRITDARRPDFAYYHSNVSTSPEMFARQMAYVVQQFHVIDLASLRAFIEDGAALPTHALLITFDDGYADFYNHAYPVLQAYGLPAVMFLVTDYVGTPALPWWDECAWYVHHTARVRARLPLLGECELVTPGQRVAACKALVERLKHVVEPERTAAIEVAGRVLEVSAPPRDPSLFMTWAQVREVTANRIDCQSHTATHPILTQVSPAEQYRQLSQSRAQIEQHTGRAPCALAYPNGGMSDYDESTKRALRDTGYRLAFTLAPGPARLPEVRRDPLAIARVFLGYGDTFAAFAMKLSGLPRVGRRRR